jgi:hypothetical protein
MRLGQRQTRPPGSCDICMSLGLTHQLLHQTLAALLRLAPNQHMSNLCRRTVNSARGCHTCIHFTSCLRLLHSAAGYGGQGCAQLCGGSGEAATYGPPGRALSSTCQPCSSQGKTIGFSFNWNSANDLYSARTISRVMASSSIDCLSEYAQTVDGAWYLPLTSSYGTNTSNGVPSFSACVDICSSIDCQLVTYDYVARTCTTRVSIAPTYEGAPWLALKAIASGYTGTSPWSEQGSNVSAKLVTSGRYMFYQVSVWVHFVWCLRLLFTSRFCIMH